MSTTRLSPTICDRRANPQLVDAHVFSARLTTPRLGPSLIWKNGSTGSPGLGRMHPIWPSSRSPAWAPACSAAARMNSLMLDPVWRGASAMFTSFSFGWKPAPPTIARIAPVWESSDTIAASNPSDVLGRMLRASSAARCRPWSKVVWIRRPPRNSRL
jgi:hypothetical protein